MISRAKRVWVGFKKFMTEAPKILGLYLGLCGIFGFASFILEESFQTQMFSVWLSVPGEEWPNVKRTIDLMGKTRTSLVVINHLGGWVNPAAFVSYQSYTEAERVYIDALKAKAFANAPELFAGEKMTIIFRPNEKEPADGYWILKNNRVSVLSTEEFDSREITGLVEIKDQKVVIDIR